MGRELVDPEKELADIKYQLAQLAYDIFNIRLSRNAVTDRLPYDELSSEYKIAWAEAIWAAVEVGKNKKIVQTDSLSLKEQDNGYLIYATCRDIKKRHPSLFTYAKFPDNIKEEYRQLASKVHQKIEIEREEEA